jgi:bifunctional ADP-heptose synthase (sugar kinase/adenylyltransferase)
MAQDFGIVTCVDPKKDNFLSYKNVTLFKPNLKELKEGLRRDFNYANERNAFEEAVAELEGELNNSISFVTLSEHGVFIKNGMEKHYVSAHIRNISDVSGAGDTVISVATLCLVAGLGIKELAEISNIAGGLVCEESGVVSISKDKLISEVEQILK